MLIRGILISFLAVFLGFILYQFGPNFLFYIGLRNQLLIYFILIIVFLIFLVWGIDVIDHFVRGSRPKKINQFLG